MQEHIINNGNPFVYSLKQDMSVKISKEEFEKLILKLEIKRVENEYKRTG
tara:strand:+ start:339 stop:488 length:150 start_codon:yes stop_codon:yes gene_type:complete